MSHPKTVALPFLVSELLPFDLVPLFDYPCAHHNSVTMWNI